MLFLRFPHEKYQQLVRLRSREHVARKGKMKTKLVEMSQISLILPQMTLFL